MPEMLGNGQQAGDQPRLVISRPRRIPQAWRENPAQRQEEQTQYLRDNPHVNEEGESWHLMHVGSPITHSSLSQTDSGLATSVMETQEIASVFIRNDLVPRAKTIKPDQ